MRGKSLRMLRLESVTPPLPCEAVRVNQRWRRRQTYGSRTRQRRTAEPLRWTPGSEGHQHHGDGHLLHQADVGRRRMVGLTQEVFCQGAEGPTHITVEQTLPHLASFSAGNLELPLLASLRHYQTGQHAA
jgi:hypothetical protein